MIPDGEMMTDEVMTNERRDGDRQRDEINEETATDKETAADEETTTDEETTIDVVPEASIDKASVSSSSLFDCKYIRIGICHSKNKYTHLES